MPCMHGHESTLTNRKTCTPHAHKTPVCNWLLRHQVGEYDICCVHRQWKQRHTKPLAVNNNQSIFLIWLKHWQMGHYPSWQREYEKDSKRERERLGEGNSQFVYTRRITCCVRVFVSPFREWLPVVYNRICYKVRNPPKSWRKENENEVQV